MFYSMKNKHTRRSSCSNYNLKSKVKTLKSCKLSQPFELSPGKCSEAGEHLLSVYMSF